MPETHQSIDINQPVTEVWARIGNFHDFSWAPDIITRVDRIGDHDSTVPGAKRVLNGAFHETLLEHDSDHYRLKYSIDDGPSPVSPAEVSDYTGLIELSVIDDGTRVTWTSSWTSNQDEAVAFCHGIYVALLEALKNSFAH